MAIPQVGVVSTREQSKQNRSQSLSNFANAAGMFAQIQQQAKQQQIANDTKLADEYITNQLGGDQAQFWRGTEIRDEAGNITGYTPNPLAVRLMHDMYGTKKGDLMLQQLAETAVQTVPQIEAQAQHEGVVAPMQGTETVPSLQQTAPTQPSVPVSFTGSKTTQPAQRTSQPQQGSAYTHFPSRAGIPGVSAQQQQGATAQGSSQLIPPQIVETARALGPQRVAPIDQYLAQRAGTAQTAQTAKQDYTRNARGLPVAPGQENVVFPINNQTLKVFATIQPFDVSVQGATGAAFEELGRKLAGEEGAALLKKSAQTFYEGGEYSAQYDADARRIFGIDGATLANLRMNIYQNMLDGKTGEELLAPHEGSWWSTGENAPNMPPAQLQAIHEAVRTPNPSASAVSTAVSYFSKANPTDTLRIMNEPQTIDTLIERSMMNQLTIQSNNLSSGLYTQNTSVLPVGLQTVYRDMLSSAGSGSYPITTKMAPKERAALSRIASVTKREIEVARRSVTTNPRQESVNAAARSSAGMPLTVAGTMAVSRERLFQILDEMESGNMSMAIASNLPEGYKEERTYREAVRQFNLQLEDSRAKTGLSERQTVVAERGQALSETATAANIEIAHAEVALKSIELDLARAQIEATAGSSGTEAAAKARQAAITDYVAFQEKLLMDTINMLQAQAKNDPAAYSKLFAERFATDAQFAAVVKNLSSYYAGATGTEPATILMMYRSGFFRKKTEVEVPVIGGISSGAFNPITPTVTTGPAAAAPVIPPQTATDAGVDFASQFLRK
jgi:hypothetical protein